MNVNVSIKPNWQLGLVELANISQRNENFKNNLKMIPILII